jgi:hypothetical protein
MYVCDFYQTLSVKDGYKSSFSVYITYAEEEMTCSLTFIHIVRITRITIIFVHTKLNLCLVLSYAHRFLKDKLLEPSLKLEFRKLESNFKFESK